MAGQRQPTDLVVMNGRKHLTKAEIEARKNAEVTQWMENKRKVIQTIQNILCATRTTERKIVHQWYFGMLLRQFRRVQVRKNILYGDKARPSEYRI